MPPKKGTKRKAAREPTADLNGDAELTPPDRNTWPGWVEMESEPAFFNVMLKEMGVTGIKIQECLTMDDDQLAILPRPVHAFIFCFRYKDTEPTQVETECPQDVWFANQIPDFACASVALLNILNNIKGLQIGKELHDFKDFTKDLDPIGRGDAIDGFDFLKRIHNSFARETDLLNADMHMQNKISKAKKRQAAIQAQATKKARKAASDTPENKRADSAVTTPTRTSKRAQKPAAKDKTVKTEISDSGDSSPLSDPPDSDPEFTASRKAKGRLLSPTEQAPRRSGRQPKPRKDPTKLFSEAEAQPDLEGFHYVAYVPVGSRVWKLDGLDSYPHLVGEVDVEGGGDWINVAGPEIQARMMMFEGVIQFNVLAVVHDPIVAARKELAENVRELQTIEAKLNDVSQDWKIRDDAGVERSDLLLGPSPIYDLSDADLAAALPSKALEKEIALHENAYIDELVKIRKERVEKQKRLRGSVRDELTASKEDDEMVSMRRHDFGGFVKGWLGALAEEQMLKDLVDEEAA